jgi:hypothetical protein
MRDFETTVRARRSCPNPSPGPRLWFGVALLGLGLVWTLDNLRFLDADQVLEWWPLLLITLGVTKLLGWGGGVRPAAGLLWIVFGGLLLAHNLRYVSWGFDELWPVALVVLGLSLVWRSLRGGAARVSETGAVDANAAIAGGDAAAAGERGSKGSKRPVDTSTFSAIAVWSGVGRKITSQHFRGGDFTAIMGGGELDLRSAKPVPGGCVIEVVLVMGGLDVQVPPDWTVVNEMFAFMGGIEDSRTASVKDGPNVLILRGFAVMGGLEIKN